MVHFTLENQGAARMSGSQVDSSVYDGVKLARAIGPLEPTQLLHSSDSSLVVLLRSKKGEVWETRFTAAAQPSQVRVYVSVRRAQYPRDYRAVR
jgi:hypothetical protein